jgi:Leucine-rich repeat (LRR) protein
LKNSVSSSNIHTLILQQPSPTLNPFSELAEKFPNVQKIKAPNMNLSDSFGVNTFSKLEQLDLSNNSIQQFVDNKPGKLTSLKELNYSRNKIQFCKINATNGLRNLELLDLSHNHIRTTLKFDFSIFPRLKVLKLNDNNFEGTMFLTSFDNNIYLEDVYLQNNEISSISGNRSYLTIKTLFLQNNKIKSIDQLQHNLLAIEVLDLSHNNQLEILETTFNELDSLKCLCLNNVTMHTDSNVRVFKTLKNLTILSINENQLKILNLDFFAGLENLKSFRFAKNELAEFNYTDLHKKFPNLDEASIVENRWNASYLSQLSQYFGKRKIRIIGKNQTSVEETYSNGLSKIITGAACCLVVLCMIVFMALKIMQWLKEDEAVLGRLKNATKTDYKISVRRLSKHRLSLHPADSHENIYLNENSKDSNHE